MSKISPDAELKLYRVTGPGVDATFQSDGKRIWHEESPLRELHSLANSEARQLMKHEAQALAGGTGPAELPAAFDPERGVF